jgi:hypothetical protein
MNRSLMKAYGPKLPVMLAKIFGPPPLVGDEDPQLYGALFSFFTDRYDPKDIVDWLLLKDKTDLHWQALRERRLESEVIKIYLEESEGTNQVTYIITPEDAKL